MARKVASQSKLSICVTYENSLKLEIASNKRKKRQKDNKLFVCTTASLSCATIYLYYSVQEHYDILFIARKLWPIINILLATGGTTTVWKYHVFVA